jgi:hypothetical protein
MKQKLNFKKRELIAGSIAILTILLATSPSYALSVNDFFSQIIGELNSYFEGTKNELQAKIDEAWGGLKNDAKTAVNESVGDMNLPNPVDSSKKLRDKLKTKGISNESNTVAGAVDAAKELERETTRATIESVLGKQGQERTKKEIETTQKTVESANKMAEDAQSMDASQNILKVIAAQNAQIVSMLGQERTDGLQARHDAQQTNLMLTQIASAQTADRRRQNLIIDGIVAQFVEVSGWTSLDAAQN